MGYIRKLKLPNRRRYYSRDVKDRLSDVEKKVNEIIDELSEFNKRREK